MGDRNGFTLIEVMVVCMIIAILAGLAVPQTLKIMESSKLQDAVGVVRIVANAVRMSQLDYPNPTTAVNGQLATLSSAGTCGSSGPATANDLMNCRYLAQQDWTNAAYNYYACSSGSGGGCCSSNSSAVACALRKSSNAYGDFAKWEVFVLTNGVCFTQCSSTCSTYLPSNCPTI
jgi:prepilin-type N-terminal cleavage/methylation domain-containing protein